MVGTVLSSLPMRTGPPPPPAFVGWFLRAIGLGMFLFMVTFLVLGRPFVKSFFDAQTT
jgi:hypothetical protein